VIVPVAVTPSELGPGVTRLTVKFSAKAPKGVVNDFVKVEPSVTGVGEVSVIAWPVTSPTLFSIMLVTVSGAPDVMVAAVVTSPVLAVKVAFGTKLKTALMGTAQAGEALKAATATTVLRRAFRREDKFMRIS
jgi:hypothetical protein